jgi:AcrR family transcriptional regulator
MGTDHTIPQKILTATLELIAEHGLAGVGMSAVAERAGVARQTLYNHYPDVESIVTAAVEAHEEGGMATVGRLLEGQQGAEAKLEQLIRHSVAMGAHGPTVAALESSLSPKAQSVLRAHRHRSQALVKDVLREGMAEGVFRSDLDLDFTATLIQAILMAGSEVREPGEVARLAGESVRFALAAVTAHEPD